MAEELGIKVRVAGVDFAPTITSKEGVASAEWVEQPLLLRADEVSIITEDATEDAVYSHENDDPEENDYVAGATNIVCTFIKAKLADLVNLLGGELNGTTMFMKSRDVKVLEQAIRFRLKKGGAIIIPKASGYVNTSAVLNAEDGRMKFPFKGKALSQTDFPYSYIIQKADGTVQGFAAPMTTSATTTETSSETETGKTTKK